MIPYFDGWHLLYWFESLLLIQIGQGWWKMDLAVTFNRANELLLIKINSTIKNTFTFHSILYFNFCYTI